jgi:hypothetical protein
VLSFFLLTMAYALVDGLTSFSEKVASSVGICLVLEKNNAIHRGFGSVLHYITLQSADEFEARCSWTTFVSAQYGADLIT